MYTKITTEERDREIELIVEALKAMKKATSFEISDLTGIPRNRIKHLMADYVIPRYPEKIKSLRSQGYSWNEKETDIQPKLTTISKYNSEGYLDTTTYKAMKNIPNQDYIPGEVWTTKEHNGVERLMLILVSSSTSVCGLLVMDVDDYFDENKDITISIKGKLYYVNPWYIISKPAKYLGKSKDKLPDSTLELVKNSIGKALGIKPIEKVVEITKEIPVEKIIEKPAETDPQIIIDLMLAKQRADIYEKAFYSLLNGPED